METPKTLYKYVTADRALTCIPEVGDGTLRATQPAALNDPFECAVDSLYTIRGESKENRLLAEALSEINESKPVTEDDVSLARRRYGSLFTRQLFAEQLSTKFGVVSFATQYDHPLMWSHYTADGAGFAIGYDVEELHILASQMGNLGEVKYADRLPPIPDPSILAIRWPHLPPYLSVKSHHWSYENEWRLIVELDKTIGTGQTDPLGQPINLLRIPNEAVVSVYYTERTPAESVDRIRDRLSDPNNRYRAGNPIKLVMSPTSYGYEESPD